MRITDAGNYALNQWPALERLLAQGQVELDNNLVEDAIRPTIDKKNCLFSVPPKQASAAR